MNMFSHLKIPRAKYVKEHFSYKLTIKMVTHSSRHKLGITSLSRQVFKITRSSSLLNWRFCVLTGGSKIFSKNGMWIVEEYVAMFVVSKHLPQLRKKNNITIILINNIYIFNQYHRILPFLVIQQKS